MKTNKSYSIESSPFYRASSRRRLGEILGVAPRSLTHLERNPSFAVFMQDGREIQEPKGFHRQLHDRIQSLLIRLKTPDYVYSGKRGVSYIDNARAHVESTDLMAVDIKGFYSNTKKEYVFRFFHYMLQMPEDLAHLMSNICCYKDKIPTGSPLSQSLAYWSYRTMFERINRLASESGMTFSLYVDDMTFSRTSEIPRSYHLAVNSILKEYGLWLKRKKIEYYGKTQYKRVTGCVISPDRKLLVANRNREKITSLVSSLKNPDSKDLQKNYQRVLGSIASAQQIEPKVFTEMRRSILAQQRPNGH